jgi:hypothetical protein
MTLREQLEERRNQWAAFHRWETEQPFVDRAPADILADLGAIWSWLPPEVRAHDPDPEKTGVRAMHAALRHLKSRE